MPSRPPLNRAAKVASRPTAAASPDDAPPQRLTDRKRDAIVQGAMAAFRAGGYEATSMDQIAATAEVSKRTLYNHFASKEELFAEILVTLWQRSVSTLDIAYRGDVPLRDQLLVLVMQKLPMVSNADFIDVARVAIAAGLHARERALEVVTRLAEKENALLAWIRAAKKDGRLEVADVPLAAQQLESLVKGAAFWPQVAFGQPPLDAREARRLAVAAVEMFLSRYEVR